MKDNDVLACMEAIRRYLLLRPAAADTVQGIHEFWISFPSVPWQMEVTQAALDQLARSGEMESIHIAQRTIWRKKR